MGSSFFGTSGMAAAPVRPKPQVPTAQNRTLAMRQRAAMRPQGQTSALPVAPGSPASAGAAPGVAPGTAPSPGPSAPQTYFPGGPLMPGQSGPTGQVMPPVGHIQPQAPGLPSAGGVQTPGILGVPASPGVPGAVPGRPQVPGAPPIVAPGAVPNAGADLAMAQRRAMGGK